jgi:hypothetical protein
MKRVDTSLFSSDECWGIQINGLSHCKNINCRWQGLTACEGKNMYPFYQPRLVTST